MGRRHPFRLTRAFQRAQPISIPRPLLLSLTNGPHSSFAGWRPRWIVLSRSPPLPRGPAWPAAHFARALRKGTDADKWTPLWLRSSSPRSSRSGVTEPARLARTSSSPRNRLRALPGIKHRAAAPHPSLLFPSSRLAHQHRHHRWEKSDPPPFDSWLGSARTSVGRSRASSGRAG
jgi:hypothetical protein